MNKKQLFVDVWSRLKENKLIDSNIPLVPLGDGDLSAVISPNYWLIRTIGIFPSVIGPDKSAEVNIMAPLLPAENPIEIIRATNELINIENQLRDRGRFGTFNSYDDGIEYIYRSLVETEEDVRRLVRDFSGFKYETS